MTFRCFVMAVAIGSASLMAQSQSRYELTPDSLTQAMKSDRVPLSVLYARVNRNDFRGFIGDKITQQLQDAPYEIYLLTPFQRAAATAADARRKFAPPPSYMTPDLFNQEGIIISVLPGSNFLTARSVERVVLKRGDVVVQAFKSVLEPHRISNNFGAVRDVVGGVFNFRLSDFDALPLQIVVVGPEVNYQIEIDYPDLVDK